MANNSVLLSMRQNYRKIGKMLFSTLIIITICIKVSAQDADYWANAQASKTKIFTISFIDLQNGAATSAEGDEFFTSDKGLSWKPDSTSTRVINYSEKIYWKADVYCSVMRSTDGGESWVPYDQDKQEHFCGVYLEDANTGHDIASQFLNKVASKVFLSLKNNEINSLINQPQQCTEYFRSPTEGWALGWCIKNFTNNKLSADNINLK
jgi:hypothetical protein